ncbi:MAG TPA: hypothetical protein VI197_21765 [Polyangiaceae bacterium]
MAAPGFVSALEAPITKAPTSLSIQALSPMQLLVASYYELSKFYDRDMSPSNGPACYLQAMGWNGALGAGARRLAESAVVLGLASCGLTERSSGPSPTPAHDAGTEGIGGDQLGSSGAGGRASATSGGSNRGGDGGDASGFAGPWQVAAELPEPLANVLDFATGDISLHEDTAAFGDSQSHSVRVFARMQGDWVEQPLVLRSDTTGQDFGASVSVFADTLLVGAPRGGAGSVYVFERDAGAWEEMGRIRPSAGIDNGGFGTMVALSGATALVASWTSGAYAFARDGAGWYEEQQLTPHEAGRVVTLDGDTAVVGERNRIGVSAAVVFVHGPSGWEQTQRLVPDVVDPAYESDMALALSGDTLLLGTRYDRDFAGGVHVFSREGEEWRQAHPLQSRDGDEYFGRDVAIYGDVALASSWHPGYYAGSVHVFERTGGEWRRVQELVSPRGGFDSFGSSLAIFDDTVLIAAPGQGDLDEWAGSAYSFTRSTQR